MNRPDSKTIVAAIAAAIVVSLLTSCQGRKMSNMQPTGDTVEAVIIHDAYDIPVPDTSPSQR